MPIFGMNTPHGAFAAVVRGLKYEQFPTVEAVGGKYKVFPRFFISDPDCNTRAKISRTIAFDPYEDIVVDFYPCKDPMHPLNRKQTVEYENRVGAYAHEIFGGLASEGGLDHLAPTLDFALYLWSYPD